MRVDSRNKFGVTIAFVAAVMIAAACGGGDQGAGADSMLDRDLSLPPTPDQPPALTDIPPTSTTPPSGGAGAPTTKSPTTPPATSRPPATTTPPTKAGTPPSTPPVAAAAAPTFERGTIIMAASPSRICTSVKVGDSVVVNTTEVVVGANGASIPAGAKVVLEVTAATAITDSAKGRIAFKARAIEWEGKRYAVVANAEPVADLERTRTTSTASDVKKVAGGAVAGAIIGQVLGKDTKSTVVGAAAGAAAGTAVALATATHEGCMAERAIIRIALTEPLVVTVTTE